MKKIYLFLAAAMFGGLSTSAQTYFDLGVSSFTQDWTNTALITASDDWSAIPNIRGFRGDGLTGGTGTDPQTILADDGAGVLDVNANQTAPNTFSTGGVTEFEITNPTIALKGSGTAAAPYLQLYLNSTGRQFVTLNFNAIDLDGSANNAVQQIAVQYRIGTTGAFTNLPLSYIADASTGPNLSGNTTPVSVVLPITADNAVELQIRIMTTNAIGVDEWIGIDDIVVTSSSITLPVLFNSFNGIYRNNSTQLNWSAYVTGNNSSFNVEKSNDGRMFSVLTTVASQTGDHDYSYTDNNFSTGTAFYRIAFVENGSTKYSGIIKITGTSKQSFSISRLFLESSNKLQVEVYSDRQSAVTLLISDMNGKLVQRQALALQTGTQVMNITLPELRQGAYTLVIDRGGERIARQWIK